MPPLGFMGAGKRQPDRPPPQPVAVAFGTDTDRQQYGRLLFVKYLIATRRLGRGDLAAEREE